MRLGILLLLAACGPDPGGNVRDAGADSGDSGSGDSGSGDSGDSGSGDSGDSGSGDSGDSGSAPLGCTATSAFRAGCAMGGAADWAPGEAAGVQPAGDTLVLAATGRSTGTDSAGEMNGAAWEAGTWTSPILTPGITFDGVVPSWNADTPSGTWVRLWVQARVGSAWTTWYDLGVWASGGDTVTRHSFARSSDAYGAVYTDTVFLHDAADAVRIRVGLYTEGAATPTVTRLALALADTGAGSRAAAGGEAWGITLDVPARSQMEFSEGEAWCSPTSTSMIMAWHAREQGRSAWDQAVPVVADGTWDDEYEGNGNWPFNTAWAGAQGLVGEVAWFDSLADLEPWIARGVPVALSCAWDRGELDNAPISSTNGHLLVLRGFDASGDPLVNDPAAPTDETVARTYDRAQLEAAWMGGSGGVAYLMWPPE